MRRLLTLIVVTAMIVPALTGPVQAQDEDACLDLADQEGYGSSTGIIGRGEEGGLVTLLQLDDEQVATVTLEWSGETDTFDVYKGNYQGDYETFTIRPVTRFNERHESDIESDFGGVGASTHEITSYDGESTVKFEIWGGSQDYECFRLSPPQNEPPAEYEMTVEQGEAVVQTPTPTPTATPTETPTETEGETTQDTDGDGVVDAEDYAPRDPDVQDESDLRDEESPQQATGQSGPGFGLLAALVGVGATALLARRRT